MPVGYIYVVASTNSNGNHMHGPWEVPQGSGGPSITPYGQYLLFGFCKLHMRRRICDRPNKGVGDYIFGISGGCPKRILFASKIVEVLTWAAAFHRFPQHVTRPWPSARRGMIEVAPIVPNTRAPFPDSHYRFIVGSVHDWIWKRHLSRPQTDAFFVCEPADCPNGNKLPLWFGPNGPVTNGAILNFLATNCFAYNGGSRGISSPTPTAPVGYQPNQAGGVMYQNVHLETHYPDRLVDLICQNLSVGGSPFVQHDDMGGHAQSGSNLRSSKRNRGCS